LTISGDGNLSKKDSGSFCAYKTLGRSSKAIYSPDISMSYKAGNVPMLFHAFQYAILCAWALIQQHFGEIADKKYI
jgi:hypothetical protein